MIDIPEAERHLARVDVVMRGLIRDLGPCTLRKQRGLTPYHTLVRAVAHQQLNGIAAESILGRLTALTPGPGFPEPPDLLRLSEQALRAVGFSRAKAQSLHDIAEKTVNGEIPSARQLARLDDEAAIERLTVARGVGRWTAEILLLRAGRPDVLPADDFGLRSGFRAAHRRPAIPTPPQLRTFGERRSPLRRVASWYLWRAADRARTEARAGLQKK